MKLLDHDFELCVVGELIFEQQIDVGASPEIVYKCIVERYHIEKEIAQ